MADPDLALQAAPLTRPQAEAAIAQRLAALGHPPDYLAAAALDELIARSDGSPGGLRRALSAALFLAATEDLPQIDAAAICRAVPDPGRAKSQTQAAPPTEAAAPASVPANKSLRPRPIQVFIAGAATFGAIAVVLLFAQPAQPPPQPPPVQRAAQRAPASLPHPFPEPPSPAPPAKPEAVATLRQPAPQPPPQQPPAAPAPLAGLSLQPEGSVLLLLPAHVSRAQTEEAAAIRQALRGAGLAAIREARRPRREPCRAVCYFYAEDQPLAGHVATLVAAVTSVSARQNPVRPVLFIQPTASPAQRPGSVAVNLP